MAKFGFLYLHEGKWEDEQIIPADWIKASFHPHIGDETSGYGYFFWLTTREDRIHNAYVALGAYDQYIAIIPDEELIVVQTANSYDFFT